jgi:hypothetical protein
MAGEGIELHIGRLEAIDTGEALEACRATFSLEETTSRSASCAGSAIGLSLEGSRRNGRVPCGREGRSCCRACGAVLAFPLAAVTTNKEKHHAGQRPDQNGFP